MAERKKRLQQSLIRGSKINNGGLKQLLQQGHTNLLWLNNNQLLLNSNRGHTKALVDGCQLGRQLVVGRDDSHTLAKYIWPRPKHRTVAKCHG